jgi:hypothetical protein
MKNQNYYRLFVVLAGIVLLSAVLACNGDKTESITTTFEQYYSIDPQLLLDSITQDSKDLFTPIETQPDLPPLDQQVPVNWSQADYLRIVDAIYRNVWSETLNDWSLKSMSFALGCTRIDHTFQNAHFRYFKNIKIQERDVRIERSIQIDPRSKSIYILEFEYYPRLTDWGSIDMAQVRYSADDALMIAEKNGGQAKRLAVENVCDITLLLSPDSASYRGWDIRYSNRNDSRILRIQIDPDTGEIYFP